METSLPVKHAMKIEREKLVQNVFDIFDADDGKTFEEKRAAAINYLKRIIEPDTGALDDPEPRKGKSNSVKDKFWSYGDIACEDGITLRDVDDVDREGYLKLQRHYSVMKSMLKEDAFCNMVWREHRDDKVLALSIIRDGDYVGYCSINNINKEPWEIGIEVLPELTNKGIGSKAIAAMLGAIKTRLGVAEFRVRIDPANRASQKLFEKLGATPNGISTMGLLSSEELEKLEEEELHRIDADLIRIAEKFSVEPRKLLSHVLEYSLTWDKIAEDRNS